MDSGAFRAPGLEASHTRHPLIYKLHSCVRTKKATSGVRCMTSQQIPVSILRQSSNILESLSNLLYLAEIDADDPQKVRTYLSLSKERLDEMSRVRGRGE